MLWQRRWCHVGALLLKHLLSLFIVFPTISCSFIKLFGPAAGSLSTATTVLSRRRLEEAAEAQPPSGSVTVSASRRVPEAIHFLNSGRKQHGRAGAAGQRGPRRKCAHPAQGGRGICQGQQEAGTPSRSGHFAAPAALPGSHLPFSLSLFQQKGFRGAVLSLLSDITPLCSVLEVVLGVGWAPGAQQRCRGTVAYRCAQGVDVNLGI